MEEKFVQKCLDARTRFANVDWSIRKHSKELSQRLRRDRKLYCREVHPKLVLNVLNALDRPAGTYIGPRGVGSGLLLLTD